jgi:hypothetical protein
VAQRSVVCGVFAAFLRRFAAFCGVLRRFAAFSEFWFNIPLK